MSSGGHTTARTIGAGGRYAVGLFGGSGLLEADDQERPVAPADRIPFPPHTVVMLAPGHA
jgi:hypothetical protein